MYTLAGRLANVYISQLMYTLADFAHQLRHIHSTNMFTDDADDCVRDHNPMMALAVDNNGPKLSQ